jgi:hypothetical protein
VWPVPVAPVKPTISPTYTAVVFPVESIGAGVAPVVSALNLYNKAVAGFIEVVVM